ncbi:MAG TPA: sigma factor-like helix-turn-helix DNA-binding protein [Terriglobales bacterium]|nr:sigma factor-like helix-turn-helix DNA-binding protein [Terriglobales bacterium]
MATQTQVQIDAVPGCVHEQICQAVYEQQRKRIQALCQWMTTDLIQARQLAFVVFVGAWRQPGQSWPAVNGDLLAETFATCFRDLFHSDAAPVRASSNDPAIATGRPQLVKRNQPLQPVRDAVSALPSAHRLLYLLHELEGYSAARLAEWLGLEPTACAHMIHEARLQLRRRLRCA